MFTRVITVLLSFSICTGHDVFNAEELLQKVVEILEYLVKEKKDEDHQHDEEISAILDRMELRLKQLENATAVPSLNPTCAPCPNKTCTHCPDRWIRFQGSCYLFVHKEKRNFAQAAGYCHSLDAHLVYVESDNENRFLKSQLRKDESYWIGLSDIDKEGIFKWENSDKPVPFTDWNPNQPDNDHEDCVSFYQKYNHKWNDITCTSLYNSICEKDT